MQTAIPASKFTSTFPFHKLANRQRNRGFAVNQIETSAPPCLPLWGRWPSEARTERVYQTAIPSQSPSVTAPPKGEPRGCTCILEREMEPIRTDRKHPLPLPMGEVAERSEDGEGILGCNTLSVTFGDSSPKDANQ